MVNKKQRRRQLARASALRQAQRRQRRAARRRRMWRLAGLILGLAAVVTLVVWAMAHDSPGSAPNASSVYYDADSVARTHHPTQR